MTLRFQQDYNLSGVILRGVRRREPAVDFQSAAAASFEGMPDPGVLLYCEREERVLVTHDRRTMPRHLRDHLAAGHLCPGVIIVPQAMPVGAAIDQILIIWASVSASEMRNRIEWLPL